MKAIPKYLLIHTAQIQDVAESDAWGKTVLSEPVQLRYVRLEPSTKYVRDKQNQEIQLAAVLIYDCKNSLPVRLSFSDGQIITFNGEVYQIQLIEPLFDGRRLHHYELGLIRYAKD